MSLDVASGRWHTVILSMPHKGSLRAILKDKIFQGGTPQATFAGRIVYVAAEFSTIRLISQRLWCPRLSFMFHILSMLFLT